MKMNAHTQWAVGQMQRYLREGNAAAVVEIGEHVLARDDEDWTTFRLIAFCLASAYEKLERWDEALRQLRQCQVIDPSDPTSLAARGRVLMKMGRNAEAVGLFRGLATRHPDQPNYLRAAGLALLHLGDSKSALGYLRRAREINSTDPYLLNDLASAYLLEGDLESSLSAFKQATGYITSDDLELARDIRESVEEVRAALLLSERSMALPTQTQIAEVHEIYPQPSPPADSPAEQPKTMAITPSDPARTAGESKVRTIVIEAMTERGMRPRQILAALHLWSDYFEILSATKQTRMEQHTQSWAAAVVYAIGRLDGETWAVQEEVAKSLDVSKATLSRRFGRLRQALTIEVGDPRYCTTPNRRRATLIEHIHHSQVPPERLLLR